MADKHDLEGHYHDHGHHGGAGDRHGARQGNRFDPRRAALLDDPQRLEYLPPDRIFELMAAPNGARVIDFGTGTGAFAFELARRRPDLEIVALDEQPEMLDLLRAKPEAAQLKNVIATHSAELPRLRGSAERVMAINVLHELGDEATRELAALLKPEGMVIVVDWNGAIDRPVGPPRASVYTPAEGRARLEHAGLEVSEVPAFKYHYVLLGRRA